MMILRQSIRLFVAGAVVASLSYCFGSSNANSARAGVIATMQLSFYNRDFRIGSFFPILILVVGVEKNNSNIALARFENECPTPGPGFEVETCTSHKAGQEAVAAGGPCSKCERPAICGPLYSMLLLELSRRDSRAVFPHPDRSVSGRG